MYSFRDFDQESADFTLEKIIDMEMQTFSETINVISYAATMELNIENVCIQLFIFSNEFDTFFYVLHNTICINFAATETNQPNLEGDQSRNACPCQNERSLFLKSC